MFIPAWLKFQKQAFNEAKFGLSCIAASLQLRSQITDPNGDRNTGVVLYYYYTKCI